MTSCRQLRVFVTLLIVLVLPISLVQSTSFAQDTAAPAEATPAGEESETVADTVPPAISGQDDLVAAAVDASGAIVEFALPDAFDDVDGAVAVDCSPASGSLFPLGSVVVTCAASDAVGNEAQSTFKVTVSDQTAPQIETAEIDDLSVDATEESGVAVEFVVPPAVDNVDTEVPVTCDVLSGDVFSVGETIVTCSAQDAAGNVASPVTFSVTVNAPPDPTPTTESSPTDDPTSTEVPTDTETPSVGATTAPATETPTTETGSTATATPTQTPKAAKPTSTPTPTPTSTVPVRAALDLPWPPPNGFSLAGDGGPLGPLVAIWGNEDYPISQEFGHTEFSIANAGWYAYGLDYGLDGYAHTGLDIAMSAGTPLYSPVSGVVKISGGTPYFTFYGNGQPGVGELLIETEEGHEVVLGHMGRIAVEVGDEVEIGDFVGLSGGDNGDHLHLEIREKQPAGGLRIVDPRQSFVVDSLEKAQQKSITPTPNPGVPRDRPRG